MLPLTGKISLNNMNVELNLASNSKRSLGQSTTRLLFGVASGKISLSGGRGKSSVIKIIIDQNTQNFNLLTAAQAAGFVNDSSTPIEVIINSNVYVWSDDTTIAAFDTGAITGSGTVTITNNGYIMGRGGNPGIAGGVALNLQKSIVLYNNGFVAGGGGGGGGGGAGGGTTSGRTSAGLGQSGSDGIDGTTSAVPTSGCGGRVLATNVSGGIAVTGSDTIGVAGKGGQAGGSGASFTRRIGSCGSGGYGMSGQVRPVFGHTTHGGGGGWGAASGSSVTFTTCGVLIYGTSGAGGSNNNVGGDAGQGGYTGTVTRTAGAAGGKSIQLNGYVCTQAVTGTIWGIVS
jgi:hypothetical protein